MMALTAMATGFVCVMLWHININLIKQLKKANNTLETIEIRLSDIESNTKK